MTASPGGRPRFPASVYAEGGEPDPRFTLANERTFLAWIRTALALIAGGVAVEAFDLPFQPALRLATSILLLMLGLVLPVGAWFDWGRTERALRRGEPLPHSVLALPLSVGVSLAGCLVLAAILL